MSDPVWLFRKAVRMKRRDSGNVWNHGVFYFGDLFSYRPLVGSEGGLKNDSLSRLIHGGGTCISLTDRSFGGIS